jgi:ribulose 1,5-bisphosphate synthetase/thiazole synthase
MDERASIPPTLPRPNPTISGWQDPPDAIANFQSTAELPETADVVIIGSGISGASIALGILDAGEGLNVVMLEARQACSGATGRNGEL